MNLNIRSRSILVYRCHIWMLHESRQSQTLLDRKILDLLFTDQYGGPQSHKTITLPLVFAVALSAFAVVLFA